MTLRITLILLLCSIGAMAGPRKATLAEQKMCAEQANKYFHDTFQGAPPDLFYWHTSHYDADASICYVRVDWIEMERGAPKAGSPHSLEINDAFEGTAFAHCTIPIVVNKTHYACAVFPPGKDAIWPKSEDEFKALIHKYFNLDY